MSIQLAMCLNTSNDLDLYFESAEYTSLAGSVVGDVDINDITHFGLSFEHTYAVVCDVVAATHRREDLGTFLLLAQ